jgi:hypothetical protein
MPQWTPTQNNNKKKYTYYYDPVFENRKKRKTTELYFSISILHLGILSF